MNAGDLIWDAFQQYQIYQNQQANGAVQEVVAKEQAGMKTTIGQLEEKLDRLALVCRAMFELLEERTGLTEQELAKKIAEVDLRDGHADGKMTAIARPCPSCDSVMSPRFNRCFFCGYRDVAGDPFNVVK